MNTPRSTGVPSLLLRVYRWVLWSFPGETRRALAEEVFETFRKRAEDAAAALSRKRLVWFWIRETWAVLRTGARLRWEGRMRKSPVGHERRWRIRPEGGGGTLDGIFADVRLALRELRRAPGFTAAAVLVLALGIGANTTAFTAVRAAILAKPPFPNSERLVMVDLLRRAGEEEESTHWPYPLLLSVQDVDDRLIDPLVGFDDGHVILTGMGPASRIGMEIVSPGYFEVVGLPLSLGRGFTAAEGEESGPYRVVVVSHSFWRGRLGGDRTALDRVLQLDGESFRVVGVAPPGFAGLGGDADLWLPLGSTELFRPGRRDQTFNHQLWVVGRLREGVTLTMARAQLRAIARGLSDIWPASRYGLSARSFPDVWVNQQARKTTRLLALGALMVLLVACANLSGLLLTRARRRVRDGAVRMALGAPRWRLIRLYLVESLVLALLGGIVGVGLAVTGSRMILAVWPSEFLSGAVSGIRVVAPGSMTVDGTVLAFALVIALATALLVGVAPALRVSSRSFVNDLKAGSGGTRGRGQVWGVDARAALVGGQVCLALVLLIGAGLVGRSVVQLMAVDEGFHTDQVLTFDYSQSQSVPGIDLMDPNTMAERIALAAQFDDLLIQRLNALPEVVEATVGCGLLQVCAFVGDVAVDGRENGELPGIGVLTVQDRYFETLGIPIRRGRGFTPQDGFGAPPVVVLSESAAETFFPGEDPVGHTISIGFAPPAREEAEIVGVAGEVLYGRPDEERTPVAYFSTRERRFANHVIVRTTGNPSDAVRVIRNEIAAQDPTVAMSNVASVDALISRSVGDRGMILGLLGLFATITVLLAAVGTWGVVGYAVADLRKELSLRVALGARSRDVLNLVTRQTLGSALLGLGIGVGGALFGTRILRVFLWETGIRDPLTYFGGTSLLLFIVLAASYIPARRALQLDPAQALKEE